MSYAAFFVILIMKKAHRSVYGGRVMYTVSQN